MKIGLMSDTHDRIEAVERAVDLFNRLKVKHVLHAGDLVSPFVVPRLGKLRSKLHYVWGNNEGDREMIAANLEKIGVKPLGNFASLRLGNRRIALMHGTHEAIVQAVLRSGSFDVVARGHSHRAEVRRGRALYVNPGETCGYLSGHQTVATIDLAKLRAEILEL